MPPSGKARLLIHAHIAATGWRVDPISSRSTCAIAAPICWSPKSAHFAAPFEPRGASSFSHRCLGGAAGPHALSMDIAAWRPRLPGSVADDQGHVLTIPFHGRKTAAHPWSQARGRHLATPVLGAHDPRRAGLRRSYGLHPFQSGQARACHTLPPTGRSRASPSVSRWVCIRSIGRPRGQNRLTRASDCSVRRWAEARS